MALLEQLLWIDPLTIARRTSGPFVAAESRGWILVSPLIWLGLGLFFLGAASRRSFVTPPLHASRRAWLAVAGALLLSGFLAPDTMGETHGHYLPQRLVLLGLLSLVPVVAIKGQGGEGLRRLATFALAVGLAIQSAFVWEYALRSDRQYRHFAAAGQAIGRGQRLGVLLLDLRSKFRANSLLHMDNWLGVSTNNVVWSNYEAAYYYFPVRIVDQGTLVPPVRDFEAISIMDAPEDAERRAESWRRLLETHHSQIDVIVLWGEAPGIADATGRLYTEIARDGPLSVWTRRDPRVSRQNQESSGWAGWLSSNRRPFRSVLQSNERNRMRGGGGPWMSLDETAGGT